MTFISKNTRTASTGSQRTPAAASLAEVIGNAGIVTRCTGGSLLFSEGEAVRGVHILEKGHVKISMDSADGKRLVLKIAKPGDVLDLGPAVVGRPHEVTAEAMEDCELRFVAQQEFMAFLQKDARMCLLVAEALGHAFHEACRSITLIGLSRSAESRIAELLLRDIEEGKASKDGVLKLGSTHEQIAQRIGTSRETVTRVLARLRRARIIDIDGKSVTLRNPELLHRIGELNESIAEITGPMPAMAGARFARAAV